jgi:hypothetical protein
MVQETPSRTETEWAKRIQDWAIERWGEARALAIGEEIHSTAHHLALLAEFPLEMEQTPAFFIEEP